MRKQGKKIKNNLALLPGKMKRTRYELDARAALVALQHGCANTSHLADLFVLAHMADEIGCEAYIKQHSASVKRLCEQIHDGGYKCSELTYEGMRASVDVLLQWIAKQSNKAVAEFATKQLVKMGK